MHSHCFAQYARYNYTCPVCAKSMGDMSVYFRMLDSLLARDAAELPPAYAARCQARPATLAMECGGKGVRSGDHAAGRVLAPGMQRCEEFYAIVMGV